MIFIFFEFVIFDLFKNYFIIIFVICSNLIFRDKEEFFFIVIFLSLFINFGKGFLIVWMNFLLVILILRLILDILFIGFCELIFGDFLVVFLLIIFIVLVCFLFGIFCLNIFFFLISFSCLFLIVFLFFVILDIIVGVFEVVFCKFCGKFWRVFLEIFVGWLSFFIVLRKICLIKFFVSFLILFILDFFRILFDRIFFLKLDFDGICGIILIFFFVFCIWCNMWFKWLYLYGIS